MPDETPTTEPSADDASAVVATAEVPPEPDPVVAQLAARFEVGLGDGLRDWADAFGHLVVRVRRDAWRPAAELAKRDLACDFLSFVAGIDWRPADKSEGDEGGDTSSPVQPTEMTFGAAGAEGRFQVFAHVESTSRHWGVTIKVDVEEANPRVPSWVGVYPGADWHERECWEMFGITFDGHPSLRHLYLPGGFEGHPLRKDFPLLAREVKPWPGLVDVEPMPGGDEEGGE